MKKKWSKAKMDLFFLFFFFFPYLTDLLVCSVTRGAAFHLGPKKYLAITLVSTK